MLALNQPQEAITAYTRSLQLHLEAGNPHLATEPMAGLIRAALVQNRVAEAVEYAKQILAHLEGGSLNGTLEPIRVRLSVYQALVAAQEPCAKKVLDAAYQVLMAQANKITDPNRRQLFLKVFRHIENFKQNGLTNW